MILGPNFKGRINANSKYRGVDRLILPDAPEDPLKAEALDKAFEKYMILSNLSKKDGEYISDYQAASEIALTYTQNNDQGDTYEVIEVNFLGEKAPKTRQFLGYDIIMENEHGSAIIDLFNSCQENEHDDLEKLKNKLNSDFLFNSLEAAKEFYDEAAKKLGIKFTLKIVGLYI